MPKTPNLTKEQIAEYRSTALLLQQQEEKKVVKRQLLGWKAAQQAAKLLKKKFGAQRVALFGSMVHDGCFTRWSDVDIAAWGIPPHNTFRAVGAVMGISQDIKINLVDVETCSPSLLSVIEQEGKEL